MPSPWNRFILLIAVVWALGLAAFVAGLERPRPLFVNVGAGDGTFARGFRPRWERDGLTGSGETMFRWAEDGSRLELPLSVGAGHLAARIRLARFAPGPIEVTVEAGGREVDRWVQPSLGWRVRDVDLGEVRGPLDPHLARARIDRRPERRRRGLGRGPRRRVRPPRARAGMAARPLLPGPAPASCCWSCARPLWPASLGAFAALVAAAAVWRDRLGGASACADAAVPAVLTVLVVAGLDRVMARFWPDVGGGRLRAVAVPLFLAVAALVAFFHPFYYYPDVDTHGRFLRSPSATTRRSSWIPRSRGCGAET